MTFKSRASVSDNMSRICVTLLWLSVVFVDAADHWAYQTVETTGKSIDSLLEAKLEDRGFKVQPPASKKHLLRRLHLNLTGLAPTRKELHAFLKNDSPRAYEQIVDSLLASPHYGERWGRHWLDVWRYSDWYGLGKQLRTSQKHMWRWRDWVVKSLNDDKGYDRMIVEMLAGDELDPANPEVVVGTGYLARNYYLFNRTTWLDNTIEHSAKAFLGMTMNCAKCHDHKYDPITHEEYYRFRAIFEPHQARLDAMPGQSDFEKDGLPRVFDDQPEALTFVHLKGDASSPDKKRKIRPGVPALFADLSYDPQPIDLPAFAFAPGTRDYVTSKAVSDAESEIVTAKLNLVKTRKALAGFEESKAKPAEPVFADDFSKERPTDWNKLGKDWAFRDGNLVRHTAARVDNLTGKFKYPRDMEIIFRYRTTGGATYKSIGVRWDLTADGKNYNQVYTSAHKPGPKIQVSYQLNGKPGYPAPGRKAMKIEIGHLYEMRLLIRDRLVNVFLDGEFILAHEVPQRRDDGVIELSAFDATCEFQSLEIRELPEFVALAKPGEKSGPTAPRSREELLVAVETAEMNVARKQKGLASLKATIAADAARAGDSKSEVSNLGSSAARAEWAFKLADNEYLQLRTKDKKKLAGYRKAIGEAKKKLENPGTNYTSLRGSLKALETPEHKFGDYEEIYSRRSTGRRLALANWITDERNPLTARVAVNHIWMRHFGTPLVESVSDFGPRAKEPLHRDLLDTLAADLVKSGWSMKRLHKRILMSSAYRRSSSTLEADAGTMKEDAANHYYWRMNPRRMESQLVRDNLLHLAGTLDGKIGGVAVAANAKSNRRSIYFKHGRDDVQKFLSMFDDADFLQCYRRSESVVPQQALALSNSADSLASAERIAGNLKGAKDFVDAAFETVLGRAPNHYESAECEAFLREISKVNGADQHVRLIHALVNHNDFVVIR